MFFILLLPIKHLFNLEKRQSPKAGRHFYLPESQAVYSLNKGSCLLYNSRKPATWQTFYCQVRFSVCQRNILFNGKVLIICTILK